MKSISNDPLFAIWNGRRKMPIPAFHKPKKWSDEEIQYLIDNYKKKTISEIAVAIERDSSAVRNRYYSLRKKGIIKGDYKKESNQRTWTKSETQYIKDNYPKRNVQLLSKDLNRTIRSIEARIERIQNGEV